MQPGVTRFPLHTAQLQTLRNLSAQQLPERVVTVVVRPTHPTPRTAARAAVEALLGRHEALRSRLVYASGGEPLQEVVPVGRALRDAAWEEIEVPAAGPDPRELWRTVPVPPDRGAVHCTLFGSHGRVSAVRLSVSHLFSDGLGGRALHRDLRDLLGGVPLTGQPPQASAFVGGAAEQRAGENTEFWKRALRDAPRACTYSGARRHRHETLRMVMKPLTEERTARIAAACRQLRITPYAFWSTAVSALVSGLCGQHHQVLRTTYANRDTLADLGAVAQLAQAVYVPLPGSGDDTLRVRAGTVARALQSLFGRGAYHTGEVLDWLNHPARLRGAVFRPSFELNYMPLVGSRDTARPLDATVLDTRVRIEPLAAKADLQVAVTHREVPVLRIAAAAPLAARRGVPDVFADCLRVVDALCAWPDLPLTDLPVRPLVPAAALLTGHYSNMAVDPAMTRELVMSGAGVRDCRVDLASGTGRGRRLRAFVTADARVSAAALRAELCARQVWYSGSAVPDEVVIAGS